MLPHAKRLLAERSAGERPFAQPLGTSPFENDLNQTLARLGAMNEEPNRAWWQELLTRFEQTIVQPDLFHVEAIKEWLSREDVRADLKGLVRAHIHGSECSPEVQSRLAQTYMNATGEAAHLAEGPIQIAVAVMVAGAVAPLDHGDRLLLDSQRGLHQGNQAILRAINELKGNSESNPTLDAAAKTELERIKKRRFIPGIDSRLEIKSLLVRIEGGDLKQTSAQVQAEMLRWSARLHAIRKDSWKEGQTYLERAETLHPGPAEDVAIIKAWILFEQGAEDEAIQSLRAFDTAQVRSNKLSMLTSSKGNVTALEWVASQSQFGPKLFSPVGWWRYAIILHEEGRRDEAIAVLEPLGAADWDECPDIPFVLGLFHAAQLLPEPLRRHVLDHNGSLISLRLNEGQEADEHRNHAIVAFQQARNLLRDMKADGRIEGCDYWLMWLTLSSPKTRDDAALRLQAKIASGDNDLQLIDLAITYGVPFDWEQVNRQFQSRELEGGLTDREEAARFTLLRHHAPVEQFLDYVDKTETRLEKILDPTQLALLRVEKLIGARRHDEAEHLLDTNPLLKDHPDTATARLAIADVRGHDVTGAALNIYQNSLESPDQTSVLPALHNLVTALLNQGRQHDVIPHVRGLFALERTAQNLNLLTDCLLHTVGHGAVLAELEQSSDLLAADTAYGHILLERKADALCHLGRFREAREVNDSLLAQNSTRASLIHRDVMIALRSGDWEHFPVIVDRHFGERSRIDVPVLLQLAHAIGDCDRDTDRAMELLREAAAREPDDANIQISCYSLACDLGREDEAGPWLQRATELSGDGNAPIRSVSLDEIVEMARRNAEEQDVKHRRFFSGEIALHMSAMEFRVPLTRLLVSIPRANERQVDGRNRMPVAIRSGNRAPEPPRPDATMAMDVTTLLLLQEMNLLDVVWNATGQIKVSPRIMDFLFREIRELPFHQPSRISKARTLIGHVEAGRISVIEPMGIDPRHEAEFGADLAHLLDAARCRGGRVVALAQIHKAATLGKEMAKWGDAASLVLSTRQLAEGLRRLGHLESEVCGAALTQLSRVDSAPPPGPDLSGETVLFIDDLALTYLTDAGLLEALVHNRLSLFLHPSTVHEARQLIAADEEGREAVPTLKILRQNLAEYYRQGRLSFLPEGAAMTEEDGAERDDRWLMLRDLMEDLETVDTVVIDDRWIGRNRHLIDRQGKTIPVHGVIDLINLPAIDERTRHRALRHLWRRGFTFLPLIPDLVREDLLSCFWDEGTTLLRESAELRAIRQTLCRIRSVKMVRIGDEVGWLDHLAMVGGLTIHRLWDDETISEVRTRALSDWVVENLIPWPEDWQDSLAEGHWIDLELAVAQRLFPLVIVRPHHASKARKQAYGRWLDEKLIQPLLGAAPRVVDLAAESLAQQFADMTAEISDELEG